LGDFTGKHFHLLSKDASIFNPDFYDIKEKLSEQMEEYDNMKTRRENAEAARERRHQDWETRQLKNRKVSSRATPLSRIGFDQETDSRFGLHDYDAIDNRERNRAEIAAEKIVRAKSIQRSDISREDKHKQWENNIKMVCRTYQDYESGWLNKFVNEDEF
jgi:hypothetical protein